jgi:hypothetical protein
MRLGEGSLAPGEVLHAVASSRSSVPVQSRRARAVQPGRSARDVVLVGTRIVTAFLQSLPWEVLEFMAAK